MTVDHGAKLAVPERDPESDSGAPASPAPLGVLWTWVPEDGTTSAPQEPFAAKIAEIVGEIAPAPAAAIPAGGAAVPVGGLWAWTPPETAAPVPVPVSAPVSAPVPVPISNGTELTTARPVFSLDPFRVLPKPAPLAQPTYVDASDDQYWSGTGTRPRRVRGVVTTALLVAVCAALPWVVPAIPALFAKAVPEQPIHAVVTDPVVTPAPVASPIVPSNALAGRRLAAAGIPLEVTVPRLHVHSPVVPITVVSGTLVPPRDPQLLGWWQDGRRAGAAHGSVVVTGHTVSTGGGAFDHLGELVPGDRIQVQTAAGSIVYVVQVSHAVRTAELARTAAEIFTQSGPGRLVLITCSGFNGTIYLTNSVVYAVPVKDRPLKHK